MRQLKFSRFFFYLNENFQIVLSKKIFFSINKKKKNVLVQLVTNLVRIRTLLTMYKTVSGMANTSEYIEVSGRRHSIKCVGANGESHQRHRFRALYPRVVMS